ncbi:MAG: MotA/TolQ/ExbB proton channel family protein [Kiritimatiellae bacterium]|nr:MotA/TolQ/ExbB proton channel family protein [Kiritimatiellia bacterium]
MTFAGGPVFWILAAAGVVVAVTFVVRIIELRRAQIDYQDFLKGVVNVLDSGNDEEALAICEDVSAPVAQVVATAIRNRGGSARALRDAVDSQGRAEIGRLDRRLSTLAIIAQVSPLLGLLGTVIGFIKTVMAANTQALVSRADLLNGSMEALVSAAAGLAVAIPAAVMYGSLRVRLDRVVVELEAAASQIIGYLSGAGGEEAPE